MIFLCKSPSFMYAVPEYSLHEHELTMNVHVGQCTCIGSQWDGIS